ncbi:MAG: Lrp/AsnC family transcriptional regulator [Pseudomonadota bacterium]
MDEIDVRILHELAQDARASVERIAERVGLSATPVRRRMRRLEQNGALRRYTIAVDLAKCGLSLTAYVSVKLSRRDRDTLERFEERVRLIPEISRCVLVTGPFDYVLTVHTRDMKAYDALMRGRLAELPGVFGIETSVEVSVVKDGPAVPPSGA